MFNNKYTLLSLLFFSFSNCYSQSKKEIYATFEGVTPLNIVASKLYPRGDPYQRTKLGFSLGYRNFIFPNDKDVNFHYGLELLSRSFNEYFDGSLNTMNPVKQTSKTLHLLVSVGTSIKISNSKVIPKLGIKAGFGPGLIDKQIQFVDEITYEYYRKLTLVPNRFSLSTSLDWSISTRCSLGLISTYLSQDLARKGSVNLQSLSLGIIASYDIRKQ